ncbi:MAG: alpha/beta hydrolase [Dysgonamonadaceae bacterium]
MNSIKLLFITLAIFMSMLVNASIDKRTEIYAIKDGQELKVDIYTNDSIKISNKPCLVFVFGGGFKDGKRDQQFNMDYFNYFVNKGFVIASIDYRLGMKGVEASGVKFVKAIRYAINLAVSDLFSATNYLLTNADEFNIDPTRIIISGSSAGAITVLQADYELSDHSESADVLPDDFRYAGVISFAGGVMSSEGLPTYNQRPAPTLFFHGSKDKLVPYGKIQLFKLGFFGSDKLAQRFREQSYPYMFFSMEDNGHDVSTYPLKEFHHEIEQFIQYFVFDKKQWLIDINMKDKLRQSDTSTNFENYY